MGRRRKTDRHLPQRMYCDSGRYYFKPAAGPKAWFTRDLAESLIQYAQLAGRQWSLRTLGDCFARYQAEVVPLKAKRTQAEDERALKRLGAAFRHMLPDSLTAQHCYSIVCPAGIERCPARYIVCPADTTPPHLPTHARQSASRASRSRIAATSTILQLSSSAARSASEAFSHQSGSLHGCVIWGGRRQSAGGSRAGGTTGTGCVVVQPPEIVAATLTATVHGRNLTDQHPRRRGRRGKPRQSVAQRRLAVREPGTVFRILPRLRRRSGLQRGRIARLAGRPPGRLALPVDRLPPRPGASQHGHDGGHRRDRAPVPQHP